jgi:hypothetical protein
VPPSPLHILERDGDQAQHVAAGSVLDLVLKRVRTVRGDDQEIGRCSKPLRGSKQVGIELQWKYRGSIIAHHERWPALILDDHGRIAAIAVLWDKVLSNVMDAPLEVHCRLWAKPPEPPWFSRSTSLRLLSANKRPNDSSSPPRRFLADSMDYLVGPELLACHSYRGGD